MRSSPTFVGVGLAFVVVAFVACSSSGGDSSGPPTEETIQSAASAICDKLVQCTSAQLVDISIGASQCRTRYAAEGRLQLKAPGSLLTDAQARSCISAISAASCADVLVSNEPPACNVAGTLADGASCVDDEQCASASCFLAGTATCGRCAQRVAEGGDCSQGECANGLKCTLAKKCARPAGEGASCDEREPDACAPPLGCTRGKCTRSLSVDAPCTLGTGELPCDVTQGLICTPSNANTTQGKCAPFAVARVGEPCGIVSNNPVKIAVCQNGACDNKRCVAALADGAACGESIKADCTMPAKCRNGRCAMKDPSLCK